MADNYLERKRRDYDERKKEWLKKKKQHLKPHQKQTHKTPQDLKNRHTILNRWHAYLIIPRVSTHP